MNAEGKSVLVIDDEGAMRHMLRLVLEGGGYRVVEATDGLDALERMEGTSFEVVLCDIRMPRMDGLGFLHAAAGRGTLPTVIMMSAYGTIDTALACMKAGAYDYIAKPFKPEEVILVLKKAEERLRLQRENATLKHRLARVPAGRMVGRSTAMLALGERVTQAADSSTSVLITGETGTGKELVARALHEQGSRSKGPFVAVNCAAIAAGLVESELFGHARGAFTGADRARPGLFAEAEGGTLFLDEIGELPLELQPKLLRVLQEAEILPVGDTRTRSIDVRVLAATARDLSSEIDKGRFRSDLYYRLAVVDINVPALRERSQDIPLLVEHFLGRIAAREGRPAQKMTPEAMELLKGYEWPGNVRELENFLEKTLIFCRDEKIGRESLPWDVRRSDRARSEEFSLKRATARIEVDYIRKALAATGGNRTKAARLLEISLRNLQYKMKEYGIDVE